MDTTKDEERWEGITAAANEAEAALIAGSLERRSSDLRLPPTRSTSPR